METFEIFDVQFKGKAWSTGVNSCRYFNWSRKLHASGQKPEKDDIVFYTNLRWGQAASHVDCLNKFAWGTESPEIYPGPYNSIVNSHVNFKAVFTHQKYLLDLGGNFKFAPGSTCWIKRHDFSIYEKTKLVSMIVSKKNRTAGHKFRLGVIEELDGFPGLDTFGKHFKGRQLGYKLEGLRDYAFSVAMENAQADYYFTEKLVDCFATGTVPIYYGCPGIGDIFDLNGMLVFNSVEELKEILKDLSMGLYQKMLPSVRNNFEISKDYDLGENFIYNNYKNLIEDE
tara:strand:+ start:180 stop:1031 length:852 start_codon:yes stop_codon:yes gene_type:complete